MRSRHVLLMLFVLLSAAAWAGNAKDAKSAKDTKDAPAPVKDTKDVAVRNAWGYEPLPGQDKIALEMEVTCLTSYCKLTGINSDLAASGEMQRLWASHGRMSTETITAVPLRHGHVTKFSARTISLVLTGLKKPLKAGDRLPFSLTLILGGKEIEVDGKAMIKSRQVDAAPASAAQATQAAH